VEALGTRPPRGNVEHAPRDVNSDELP